MEERIAQLEKMVSILHGEITALKDVIASGFIKVESNFQSVGMSVGLKPAALTEEINKISKGKDMKSVKS